mgnify:CR=1 FL=1
MGKRGVGLPRLDFSRKWLETHGRDMKGCLLVVFTVNRLRTHPGMHGFGRAMAPSLRFPRAEWLLSDARRPCLPLGDL